MVPGSNEQREYLRDRGEIIVRTIKTEELPRCRSLPDGFCPLGSWKMNEGSRYRRYLQSRGVSILDQDLFRLGYVDSGPLSDRIIMPFFDENGEVCLWNGRSIINADPKYRFPHATKNVVPNEHLIDWNDHVVLVEGMFDALAVGVQAIPIFGKAVQPSILEKLVVTHPPVIHVCLDTDAIRESIGICRSLMGYGLVCSLINLDQKDPSEIGRDGMKSLISKALPLSRKDLLMFGKS